MRTVTSSIAIAAMLLTSCGGGSSPIPAPPSGTPGSPATPTPTPPPTVFTPPAQVALSAAQVQQVIAQGVQEAQARGIGATIAVVDRVGNVLAVWATDNANQALRVPDAFGGPQFNTGLQGLALPSNTGAAKFGAIAKAITGAYLSSGGNAFSTRTASQIVQEHFPPSAVAVGLESGPLYGVQFSSLPCSDLAARFNPAGGSTFRRAATGANTNSAGLIGPKRTPLGLSADPGGFPLYINGVVVGGVGVLTDGLYGLDREIRDVDRDDDEAVAIAATRGFDAPTNIRAERITVDGTSLRYTDIEVAGLRATGAAPSFAAINNVVGRLQDTIAYFSAAGGVLAGTAYGSETSGIRASTAAEFSNRDAFVLTDGAGANRFPIRGGTDGGQALTPAEVRAVLEDAFLVMSAARAQIRQPLDSRAEVSLSVVDTNGEALGVIRSPDAPIFGIDVSLQKARTAMFFSAAFAAQQLLAVPARTAPAGVTGLPATATAGNRIPGYVTASRNFFNDANVFTGQRAFSNRAIGNIARPYFPDGEVARPNGPLSPNISGFNPFSVGLQSDLIVDNVVQHVGAGLGLPGVPDVDTQCTNLPNRNLLANGIQIFPGSVPIYRGNTLVGAIGISGDGIDQDDMISFLGTHNAGLRVGGINNAPPPVRSDQIVHPATNVRLRWVGCPFAPFVGSADQNVCQGK